MTDPNAVMHARERLLLLVRASLIRAVVDKMDRDRMTIDQIAERVNFDSDWLRKVLNGPHDFTLGEVADIAFACDCEPMLEVPGKEPDMTDTYPVAIIEDRYRGSYSGGAWLAIAGADRAFNDMGCRATWCLTCGPSGGDPDAMLFWDSPPDWIAVGSTPDEALAKLRSKRT